MGDANTLAKAALGLCDNLATCVLRAWYADMEDEFAAPVAEKFGRHVLDRPIVIAPAMNTYMWHQKITQSHLAALKDRKVSVVEPIAKLLACGDFGKGAMATVEEIVQKTVDALQVHDGLAKEATARGLPEFVP